MFGVSTAKIVKIERNTKKITKKNAISMGNPDVNEEKN
jgi:hypothetical protein